MPIAAPTYIEVQSKSILNKVEGMHFRWSINPYRGCAHGCHYCFARSTHFYFDLNAGSDFTSIIFVKVNAPQVLRRELSRPAWRREQVALGTATDPYQPVEGRYRLTRGILEALRDYRTPVGIVTKGTMILRDLDILADMARRGRATVCFSVTTLDRDLWRRLEPGTAPPQQRLRALERLAAAGVNAGVLLAPIVPGLTATPANLEAVVRAAADHGARFPGANVLHLRPGVREHFLTFLEHAYPHLLEGYGRLYRGKYASERYRTGVEELVQVFRERFGLVGRDAPFPSEQAPVQLALPWDGTAVEASAPQAQSPADVGGCATA
ncbi:MAG: radical SAM protein [Chloroflexi bacterium]|nr:radical SAM protein [Chloroflexota bacterium]